MAKLQFDQNGERVYETGVSEGVLFVADSSATEHELKYGKGVAWNGLTSVSESPEGAEETAIYADNIKYLSLYSAENFKATIEAYTYPDAWAACDGSEDLVDGITMGQQTRKRFCFAFKTKVGTDEDANAGYKLHIIYNATASPSDRSYSTVNESPEAITFSWEVGTTPLTFDLDGVTKTTASLVIDSTKVDSTGLAKVLDAIYGTDGVEPYIPSPLEIKAMFASQING